MQNERSLILKELEDLVKEQSVIEAKIKQKRALLDKLIGRENTFSRPSWLNCQIEEGNEISAGDLYNQLSKKQRIFSDE